MSRCFPYPPPGYVRNPVAAAEAEATTKLQNEREKAEKKEKKQGKKSLQLSGETTKHPKHTHKKRKHEDISVAPEDCRKVSRESVEQLSVEQLEKSGLSEEHGAPCFTKTTRASPESSQDSSKRRKVALPSPSENKNVNRFRIKIKREQDSPAAVLEKPTTAGHPTAQIGSGSSLIKQNAVQPHQTKAVLKSSACLQQSGKLNSQVVVKQVSSQSPANVMQRVDSQIMTKGIQKINPPSSGKASMGKVDISVPHFMGRSALSSAKAIQRVDPPIAKVMQRVDLPPAKVLQSFDSRLPSKVIERYASPSCYKVLQKETSSAAVYYQAQAELPQLPQKQVDLLQKPKVLVDTAVTKEPHLIKTCVPEEEPCFSGRKAEEAAMPEVKHSKSERKKIRKAEKKEKKFRDLFIAWNPPPLVIEGMDVGDAGDQDWLLGSMRKPDAIMSDCRARDCSLPFQSAEQQLSLQPRAIHLPELNIYQMPYVVPF